MVSFRRTPFGLILLAFVFSGCGPKVVKINGKILKADKPLAVSPDTYVTLSFFPDNAADSSKATSYSAKFDHKSGTYSVSLPPGHYRTMLIIAPPSKPGPGGKLNAPAPVRSGKVHDLTRSQELDIKSEG